MPKPTSLHAPSADSSLNHPATLIQGPEISIAPDGRMIIGSVTTLNGARATVAGAELSVGDGHVEIGSSTYSLPMPDTNSAAAGEFFVIGIGMKMDSNDRMWLLSFTVTLGRPATISGHVISMALSKIVVDSSTYALPVSLAIFLGANVLFIDGKSMQRASDGSLLVSGSSLALGSQTIISRHTFSVPISSLFLPSAIIFTMIGQTFTRLSDGFVIAGTTLRAGALGITFFEILISVVSSGKEILVGSSTFTILPAHKSMSKVAGQTLTANSVGLVIADTTFSADDSGIITLSGIKISILPNRNGFLIGSSTAAVSSVVQNVFNIAGLTLTVVSSDFVIDDIVLTANDSAVTMSGTVIALGSHGLRIGFSTFPVSTDLGELQVGSSIIVSSTASEQGLEVLIMSALDADALLTMDLAN